MPAEMLFLGILSFAILVFWFGYPLLAIYQCWKNRKLPQKTRIIWLAFIVLSWPFAALGAVVYGLVNYKKKHFKALAAAGWVCIVVFLLSSAMSAQSGKLFTTISVYAYEQADAVIIQTVTQPQILKALLTDIAQMRAEEENDDTLMQKNLSLLAYVVLLAQDDMTGQEFADWRDMYEKRAALTDNDVKRAYNELVKRQDAGK